MPTRRASCQRQSSSPPNSSCCFLSSTDLLARGMSNLLGFLGVDLVDRRLEPAETSRADRPRNSIVLRHPVVSHRSTGRAELHDGTVGLEFDGLGHTRVP